MSLTLLLLLTGCGGTDDDTGDSGDTGETEDTGETGDTSDPFAVVDPNDRVSAAIEAAIQKELDALVTEQGVTGAQVAVYRDGELLIAQSTGVRRPDDPTPVDRETLFQLGSVTKMQTAVTVLQEVDAGRLTVDEDVGDALGGFTLARAPEWTATVHELLTHQSGLYDLWDPRLAPDDEDLASSVDAFAASGWATMPGGTAFKYANTNYSLLGRLVEERAGAPWADVYAERVAAPLHMTRTLPRTADAIADGNYCLGDGWAYPEGTDWWDPLDTWDFALEPVGTVAPADATDNAWTRPAALVWTTAVDIVRFGRFLAEGDPAVLSEAGHAALVTPWVEKVAGCPDEAYGYGVEVFPDVFVGHTGNTLTHASWLVVIPDQDFAIGIVATGTFTDLSPVADRVFTRLEIDVSGEGTPCADVETLAADLVGTYVDPAVGDLLVEEAEDGALTLDIPALAAGGWGDDWVLSWSGVTDLYQYRSASMGIGFEVRFAGDGEDRWLVSQSIGGGR